MHHIHEAATTASSDKSGFFANLLESFTPRRQCMNLEADVIWLHVISDALIALAYYSIPIALVYFVRRRRDLQFNWMFLMFAAFILACGTTHLFGVWAIWNPMYRLDGLIKAGTAAVSLATAVVLWPIIPRALALPSPEQLRAINEELEQEIEKRRGAQEKLQQSRDELEVRVKERTSELAQANQALMLEIQERKAAEKERNELLAREQAARAEAQSANRVKDEFLATLSHELRTPLNSIMGWTHILSRPNIDAESVRQGLTTIDRSVRIQTRMIEDLLDMSRIITGKLRLDAQPLILGAVVEASIDAVLPTAQAKGIRIRKILDPNAGQIVGDPNRLQQVVWNLLTNAIKFTPRGGQVQVHLEKKDSSAQLTISDDGLGIQKEFLPHLFERFQQADSSTTRRHGGLGLGLSIVRHLVELHGGSVRAESPGPGKGSTFVVTLPLSTVSGEVGSSTSSAGVTLTSQKHPLTGTRVLVIDDEGDALDLVARILTDSQATVVAARSAGEALELHQSFRPDVLICDIGMPEMDGFDFLEKVRRLPPHQGGAVPAIALTAFARSEDRVRAFAAGFQVHLAKPVEPAELVALVYSLSRSDRAS